jgi:hypothetical protein
MLAARMTLPHFLVSSEMSFAKSPGRACEHCAPWIGEPRVECGICNAGEMAFPFERRAAGPADAVVPGKPTEPHSMSIPYLYFPSAASHSVARCHLPRALKR